ncbi:hypothetical protein FSARC_3430 [Fusarium sarcochroum]|uniref:HpcH/HpaI aldolase/citrate lyase domain-containing protein n=1 Tax=Fusarium sarcochroum TaxID=1208366 RepID=A0A8H4U4I3_9HYPO|nr:hypothetical protein FSARC_3430 [Fusarium sarcochroum]
MQASNRLRAALVEGKTSIGAWQMLPYGAMHDAVPAIASLGISPIVRIADMQGWMIKRALDSGAHGIIIPMLRTPEEAREVVQLAKFPPWGRRGFGSPIAPERFNPPPSLTEYLQLANDALLTIIQIETKEALQSIDEIARIDGVDVLFIGPFDLGNNIGHPIVEGAMDPELEEAIAKILSAGKGAGKKVGIYCTNGEQAKAYWDRGFDMMNALTDYSALSFTAKEQLSIATKSVRPEKGESY